MAEFVIYVWSIIEMCCLNIMHSKCLLKCLEENFGDIENFETERLICMEGRMKVLFYD